MDERKLDPAEFQIKELASSREAFFEAFFRKGAEFANDLIDELQMLRQDTQALAEENIRLKHHLASDDAIRDLLAKIEALEDEKRSLRSFVTDEAARVRSEASRYDDVERELDAMANLYVASYQLHSSLDPHQVLGTIEQLLAQFVGAGSFAIYLRRRVDDLLVLEPVHAYHCTRIQGERIAWNQGPIGEAAANQVHYVADPNKADDEQPLACIPMLLGNDTIGVIAIFGLFEQKKTFVDIDFELFKLLALHAASAIVGAGLMARAKDIEESLSSYQSL